MKDEALKLALEALEGVLDDSPKVLEASISGGLYEVVQCRDAITAIKQALAAPVQEPVATVTSESGNPDVTMSWWHEPPLPVGTKLYTTPPAAQRTWTGLTDEEIEKACVPLGAAMLSFTEVARAIEAKLKEKNT
jgi:hypothetical protein